ncbi:hypothetical protein D3C86_2034640 [compost metagenome]
MVRVTWSFSTTQPWAAVFGAVAKSFSMASVARSMASMTSWAVSLPSLARALSWPKATPVLPSMVMF